jgi:predicted alpha-1,2-mannosidase
MAGCVLRINALVRSFQGFFTRSSLADPKSIQMKPRIILLFAVPGLLMVYEALSQSQLCASYIDPFIGSQGKGNVFVGPSRPFGMVKPGPDCDVSSNSGYHPDLNIPVYGFSQVHVSGTGGGPKYGNVSVMPFGDEFDAIQQESLRRNEFTRVGYYRADLSKWNIRVELTCSPRVAFHRYIFPGKQGVKIDLGSFLGEESVPDAREAQQFVGSEVEIVSDTEIRGYTRIRGGWNNGKAYTVYFCAVFDRSFSGFGTWQNDEIIPLCRVQPDRGNKTGAYLLFDENQTDTLNLKIGISFVSSLKAAENISEEIPHWSFDQTRSENQSEWESLVSRIKLHPSTSDDYKTIFYTALYHTMLMPVDRTGENPLWKSDKPYYDDFYAIWDTYRTSHPLITLIAPSRQVDIINALLDIYKYDGYMPDARSGNSNGRTQGGSNAEVLIADAYQKGLKGINYHLALRAMLKDAVIPPGGNAEAEGRGGLYDYDRLGYVSDRYVRAGNRTLEYAFNDYCLAQVAKGLGRLGEYRTYLEKSRNWMNLWRDIEHNGSRGFIMPRAANGEWIDSIPCDHENGRRNYVPFTPDTQEWPICVCWWCGFFYEGNSWEYSLFVPHDIPGLIRQSGGSEAFRKRLDTFFELNYYDVGNEPSFLTPLLYHWIGRPDLSSEIIHKIISENYNASPAGIPGNDDSGAMSSRLAFHMMGLFPNAGFSYYLITAPLLKSTTIHFENGSDFIIETKNQSPKNCYIKSVRLNGVPFDQAWINHDQICNGGHMVLEMASSPGTWGTKVLPPETK